MCLVKSLYQQGKENRSNLPSVCSNFRHQDSILVSAYTKVKKLYLSGYTKMKKPYLLNGKSESALTH